MTFGATGGSGSYSSWSASPNATPSSGGAGVSFTTTFGTAGTGNATVTDSAGKTGNCAVSVTAPVPGTITVSSVDVDTDGGVADAAGWTLTGNGTQTGAGQSQTYNSEPAGTYILTANTSPAPSGYTFNDIYVTPPGAPSANPANGTLASGGSLTYYIRWKAVPGTGTITVNSVDFATGNNVSAPGWTLTGNGSPQSGSGVTQTYPNEPAGSYTLAQGAAPAGYMFHDVSPASTQSLAANGNVTFLIRWDKVPPGSPTCSAFPTSVSVNQPVTFSATGGTGPYSFWSASPNATPSSGSTGVSFITKFGTAGPGNATVTDSNGKQGTCSATVTAPVLGTINISSVDVDTGAGVSDPGTWTLTGNGAQTGTGQSQAYNSEPTGVYALTANAATPPPGYVFNDIMVTPPGASSANPANGTLAAGGSLNFSIQWKAVAVPAPTCSPASQTVLTGQAANLMASGGSGTYSWSAPGGTPSSGSNPVFAPSFASPGSKTVTVTDSNNKASSCSVTVNAPAAGSIIVESGDTFGWWVNDPGTWTLTGNGTQTGTGQSQTYNSEPAGTYKLTANVATPPPGYVFNDIMVTPPGASSANPANGTLTAGGSLVFIIRWKGLIPPACSPNNQTVTTGQTVNLVASFGSGTYFWSAPGGTPTSGSGTSFATSYATTGSKTITLTDTNNMASPCSVTVKLPPAPTLAFSVAPTAITLGQSASLKWTTTNATACTASGAWSGSKATGANQQEVVTPTSTGQFTYNLTCTGAGGSTSKSKTLTVSSVPVPLSCVPASQSITAGSAASLAAGGGTGVYSWTTSGGAPIPATWNGSSFNPVYNTVGGPYSATVTSGASSKTCTVTVTAAPPPPPASTITGVSVSCNPPAVSIGGTSACTATVSGTGSYSSAVTWSLVSAPGTGSIGSSGTYTAPGSATSATVKATSNQDATKSGTATIPVNSALSLTITPAPPVPVGSPVTIIGSGGCGSYTWASTGPASPSTGAGNSYVVSYSQPGTYQVTLTDACSAQKQTPVTVIAPSCTFTANPNQIIPPQSSALSWNCTNAVSCTINGTPVTSTVNGSTLSGTLSVSPTQNAIYALSCNGAGSGPANTVNVTTSVTVGGPGLHETNP